MIVEKNEKVASIFCKAASRKWGQGLICDLITNDYWIKLFHGGDSSGGAKIKSRKKGLQFLVNP